VTGSRTAAWDQTESVLPIGTVTFLLTEIEGSTRLWERYTEGMRAALIGHDALIEGRVVEHGGVVVRPRGEGDSRFAVFAQANDAVAAAGAIQVALHHEAWPMPEPLRVRMALHTGGADLRDGDYYGSPVNRCGRLRGLAHGGQVLLSGTTAALVRDQLPAGFALRSLGTHRLKGMAEPEPIFQLLHAELTHEFPPLQSAAVLDPRERRDRSRMLQRVRRTWIDGFLEASLHGAALQVLGLEERPEAVPDRWGMVVQQADRPGQTLPPDTSIVQVFNELDGELLILGEPGSGKTTLLLELTRVLLDRAEQDEVLPMPVVFPLASWAAKRLPLADWLVDELNQRYDVPLRVGHAWMANDGCLPLLDGLDEVAAEHRATCVSAINAYREGRAHVLPGLVVTSRIADYDALTARLRLRGAVLLQPLRAEQIDAYLASAGEQLAGVHAMLQVDATLQDLAASPLLLSAMTLAYQGAPAEALPTTGTVEERRSQLFATYVDRMFKRRTAAARYTREQTVHWLGWLANALAQQDQTVFYIERMQPDWLATPQLRRWYTLVDRVGGLVVGLIAGLFVGLLYGLAFTPLDGLTGGLFYGLFLGLVGALFGGTGGSPLIHGRRVPPLLRGGALGGLVGGLAGGLAIGLIEAMNRGRGYAPTRTLLADLIDWVLFAKSGGVGYVLLGVLVGGLAGALTGGPAIRPRRVMVVETLRPSGGVLSAGIVGLAVGLVVGLVIVVVGRVIDNATPLTDPVIALRMVLVVGVGFGLVFGLLGGLVGGEVEAKSRPNQGIRRSAHMAIRVGLVLGMASWLLGALVIAQIYPLGPRQATALAVALAIGLPLGLIFGGYACLSHYALRAVLWRTGALPLDTVRFLDYATERIFLRRVGGGYIFVHRLLQEYFAALENHSGGQSPTSPPPSGAVRACTAGAEGGRGGDGSVTGGRSATA
jgi:class 3 adenylate cyclase